MDIFDDLPAQQTVLLAVIGASPAVLTETVWALCLRPEPIVPDRVVTVTTTVGRRKLIGCLLKPLARFNGRTPWETLREALAAKGTNVAGKLRFGNTSEDIRTIIGLDPASGLSTELEDIRVPDDNVTAANYLLSQVRSVTANPDIRLVASLAGGRKTMGALLYACMTLSAREQDMLTHVLVGEPYERLADFYFPEQPGGPLVDPSGNSVNPRDAAIDLAEVPFVTLRNLLWRELGPDSGSFSHLVERCRLGLRHQTGENVRLIIEGRRPEIEVNGQRLKLSPLEHLLMLFLAKRAKAREPDMADDWADSVNKFREDLLAGESFSPPPNWRNFEQLRQSLTSHDMMLAVSTLRRKVQALAGEAALLAGCLPEKGRFSLDVEPALIEIRSSREE
ncbi:MAG: hypothetical protein M2R45_03547 [Verrucomicrobia subdivision 3 bacterium]|nr:hypothetical protein [Limisphaerales bacterium]MCS1416476.1 hypothetical protein [Limisphaerales bacterium]